MLTRGEWDMEKMTTFTNVQHLITNYSTMSSDKQLYELLYSVLPHYLDENSNIKNIREVYNELLLKYYPNETCIKSSFINQILLQGKTHVTIFELPVGSSRADLCKVNGKSIAYEIKTDLDNFNRLEKQLKDYSYLFEYTYLICSNKAVDKVMNDLPRNCGIYVYSFTQNGKIRFKLVKKATHSDLVSEKKQLEIFSEKELSNYFKELGVEIIGTKISSICNSYSSEFINSTFKKMLKVRYCKQWSFIKENHNKIFEIDYQWFYKMQIEPSIIYNSGDSGNF